MENSQADRLADRLADGLADGLAQKAKALDAADPLAGYRARFDIPKGPDGADGPNGADRPDRPDGPDGPEGTGELIYLDGNSLGALPKDVAKRLEQVVRQEWGEGLVGSWNSADWFTLPQRVGAKIAPLIGAAPGEVIACDSTSVNLFKLIASALAMRPGSKVVLSEPGNFPTDLYMIAGLERQGLATRRLAQRGDLIETLASTQGQEVALLLLTHVHYKSGAMHDMAALTKAAHDAGALVLWDLSHSCGALPVDLRGCGADFAVGCGYKYLNGGPGAPAFAFVAEPHQGMLEQPLTGWMGHAAPFAFSDEYRSAPDISRLSAGTPPILALSALEVGVDLIAEIGVERLYAKSQALSEFFRECLGEYGAELELVSPKDPLQRGSHLSYRHDQAFAICQALIARGVVGDFREPNVVRFGFAPAYVSFSDIAQGVRHLAEILQSGEWQHAEFQQRNAVT